MKLHNPKIKDNFQTHLKTFKDLLKGSLMAKLSCFILILYSLFQIYKSSDNMLHVVLLLLGVATLIFYMINYLSLKSIKQKSYTQSSLMSSLSKFKVYMEKRKKYEMYFIGFWIISLIPFSDTYLESKLQAILFAIFYIAMVTIFGNLAYKKTEKIIEELETELRPS